jgi:DNA-binding transcriptional MerR regulator
MLDSGVNSRVHNGHSYFMAGTQSESVREPALRIGEVAARAGVSVDAVRYYERVGLLRPHGRTSGGFRTYLPDVVERLSFIRRAQRLGLRLEDIVELLETGGPRHCERVRHLLVRRLADVDAQLAELKAFRRTLRSALVNCNTALRSKSITACPVVQSLASARRERKTA